MTVDLDRLRHLAALGDTDAVAAYWRQKNRGGEDLLTPRWDGRGYGSVDVHAEIVRRLRLYEALEDDAGMQTWVRERIRRTAHFFFDHFAWAWNPRRIVDGKLQPLVPLVPWDFQRPLIDAIMGYGGPEARQQGGLPHALAVPKSRDLGATWVTETCMFVDWLTRPADQGLITRSGTDLDSHDTNSLFGKLDHLIKHTPRWLLPRGFDLKAHRLRSRGSSALINPETGASIKGSLTVEDAFTSQRHYRVAVDEAAKVPKLAAIMASIQDVTKSPILISSAKGRAGYFPALVLGDGPTIREWGETGDGWRKLRLHYSQHPERDPSTERGRAWVAAEKAKRTPEAWAQEQEIDFDASAPGRIWPEFERGLHLYTPGQWRDPRVQGHIAHLPVFEAWDFGSGKSLTCAVWAAIDVRAERIFVLDYRCWQETPYTDVAAGIAAAGWVTADHPHGRMPDRRFGDCAGGARESDQRSWLDNLRRCGIEIQPVTLSKGAGVRNRMRVAFRENRIVFAPACDRKRPHAKGLPSLVESVEQYRRDERTGKPDKKPEGAGVFSHLSDCLQYIFDQAFRAPAGLRDAHGQIVQPGRRRVEEVLRRTTRAHRR